MTLRCTRKLLKILGGPAPVAATQSSAVLGDWYAGYYEARRQPVVVCLNERSLLAVLLPMRDAKVLVPEFRQSVMNLLTRIGIPGDAISAECRAMADITIGPTANRRILGCLNEAAFAISAEFESMHERYFGEHEDHLSRFIYSTTQYRPPHELARELFLAALPNARPESALIH